MSIDSNREKTDLSRRAFLTGLTAFAVGSATALAIGVNAADAANKTNVADEPTNPVRKTSPEGKKVEVAQNVAQSDPLQAFNQPYYRHGRRVARRTYRRGRRVVRRTYRRTRRRVVY